MPSYRRSLSATRRLALCAIGCGVVALVGVLGWLTARALSVPPAVALGRNPAPLPPPRATVPELIDRLDAPGAGLPRALVELREAGPRAAAAVPRLVELLADPRDEVRAEAGRALDAIDARWDRNPAAKQAVPALVRAIRAGGNAADPAMVALARLGPVAEEAIPELLQALPSGDRDERNRAVVALNGIDPDWPRRPETMRALDDLLRRSDEGQLGNPNLGDALRAIGPASIPALAARLGQPRWDGLAPRLLADFGKAAVPALIDRLGDGDAAARSAAAEALREIGPAGADAVPALVARLSDPVLSNRVQAAWALPVVDRQWAARPEGAAVLPKLIAALEDERDLARAVAVGLLGQYGPAGRRAVPALIAALGAARAPLHETRTALDRLDPDWRARPEVGPAVARLCDRVAANKAGTAGFASEALRQFGSAVRDAGAAVPALVAALNRPDCPNRLEIVGVLGQIDKDWAKRPDAATARGAVVAQLDAATPAERLAAVEPVLALGLDETTVPALARRLSDPFMRAKVEERLRWADPQWKRRPEVRAVVPGFVEKLADPSLDVRLANLAALGILGPAAAEAVPRMRERLRDDALAVRRAAALNLSYVGAAAKDAVADIRQAAAMETDRAVRVILEAAADRIEKAPPP